MKTLSQVEAEVYEAASVNRSHLLDFLSLQETSDSQELQRRTAEWLKKLHDDPHFSKISFANSPLQDKGPIEAIISDLGTYGVVQAQTIHESHDITEDAAPLPEETHDETLPATPQITETIEPEPVQEDPWKRIG